MSGKRKRQKKKAKQTEKKEESKIEDVKEEEKKEELIVIKEISNKSTEKEVAGFFEFKFNIDKNISNNFIKEYITGDILPYLFLNDFKVLGLNLESIINWYKYYEDNENIFIYDKIYEEINIDSSSLDVKNFLASYLNFKNNTYILNGQKLFKLNEEGMVKMGMKLGQRKKLIRYIDYLEGKNKKEIFIDIDKNSSLEKTKQFLLDKLKLSNKTVDKLQYDGEILFILEINDIENLEIPDSEKEILKQFIKAKDQKTNKFEVLNNKSEFNIFILICFKENYFNNKNISFYYIKKDNTKQNCQYRILNKSISKEISEKETCELFLIKIELNDLIDNLFVNIRNEKNEELIRKLFINNKNIDIHNYYSFNIFDFDKFDLFGNEIFEIPIDILFKEFFKFIFETKSNNKEQYEKDLIESLFKEKKINFCGNNILKVMKLCAKYKLKHFDKFDRITIIRKNKNPLIEKEYFLSDNDIEIILLNYYEQPPIFQILVYIYFLELKDKNIISELFEKSKFKKEYQKAFLEIFDKKMILPKDFFLQEKIDVIQIILLDSLKDKKDINIIIEISQNLENALNFILNNYTKIIEKFNSFSYFKTHYKIDLNNIEINNNTNIINIGSLLKKIIKLGEDNSYRLINYDELFMNLVNK